MVTMSFTREEFEEVRALVVDRANQCSGVAARMATEDWFVMHDESDEACRERWERAGRVSHQIAAQVADVARAEGW